MNQFSKIKNNFFEKFMDHFSKIMNQKTNSWTHFKWHEVFFKKEHLKKHGHFLKSWTNLKFWTFYKKGKPKRKKGKKNEKVVEEAISHACLIQGLIFNNVICVLHNNYKKHWCFIQ
jgi:hypothetical protein